VKQHLILAVMPTLLVACDQHASVATTEKVVVQTAVAAKPPASKEKKMKDLTIIVYPPGTKSLGTKIPPPLPSGHQAMSPAKQ
jgi:hypothetical protein